MAYKKSYSSVIILISIFILSIMQSNKVYSDSTPNSDKGAIIVVTNPAFAYVYLDNEPEPRGFSTLKILYVEPGAHKITVSKKGFSDAVNENINVVAGETTNVGFSLNTGTPKKVFRSSAVESGNRNYLILGILVTLVGALYVIYIDKRYNKSITN